MGFQFKIPAHVKDPNFTYAGDWLHHHATLTSKPKGTRHIRKNHRGESMRLVILLNNAAGIRHAIMLAGPKEVMHWQNDKDEDKLWYWVRDVLKHNFHENRRKS